MSNYSEITTALQAIAIPENVSILQRFFKTGVGEYAEGDVFIGVKVPEQRKVAQAFFRDTSLSAIEQLLTSPIHEYRQTALFILVLQFQKSKKIKERQLIFDFYLQHKDHINNWDLVDGSTYKIVGPYLHETRNFDYLYQLAADDNMWTKRIAVVSLWYLWKQGYIRQGLDLITMNLTHPHDLMHKANGWMLRELGKLNELEMLQYLEKHYAEVPRTTLRYAIEKLDSFTRQNILKGKFR